MHAKSLQSCLTLCDPTDCSPPGSSVPGILQARILEWVARPFPRGSSQSSDWTRICLLHWQVGSLSLEPPETHWKRPWYWEGLGEGGEGDNRGWDGWMASPIRWTWVWVDSGIWWWTRRPGVLGWWGHRVGHDWATNTHKERPALSYVILFF